MAFYTYKLYIQAHTGTYDNPTYVAGIENVVGKFSFQIDDVEYTQFCVSNELGLLVFNVARTSINVTLSRKGYYTQTITINRNLSLDDDDPQIEHIIMHSNGEIASHERIYQIFPDYFDYGPESAISESERTQCVLSNSYEESIFTKSGNISDVYETYDYPGHPDINYHNRILRTSDILRHALPPIFPTPPDPAPITIRTKVPLQPTIPTTGVTYTLPLIFFFRTAVHAGTYNGGTHHILKDQFQVSELIQSATPWVTTSDYNWNYPMGAGEWFESNDIETTPWKYIYETFYENPLLFIHTAIRYYNSNRKGFVVLDKSTNKIVNGGVITFAGDLTKYNKIRSDTQRYFVTCCYASGAAPHNSSAIECWNDGIETYRTNASALQLPVSGTLNSSLYIGDPLYYDPVHQSLVYPNNKIANTESALTFNWMRSKVVAGISHVHHWSSDNPTSNHHLSNYITSPSNSLGLCHSNLRININSFDVFSGDTFNKEDIDLMDLKNQAVYHNIYTCYIGVEPSEVHGKPLQQWLYYNWLYYN